MPRAWAVLCCAAALVAPHATPPDFSHDANVTIVARGGNSWETAIAVSPVDPRVMVYAVIDSTDQARVTLYRSTDGGVTWSDPRPAPLTAGSRTFPRSVDPVLVAASDGTFYLAELFLVAAKGATPAFQGSVIGVTRSTDGGATWSNPTLVVDRPPGGDPTQIDDKEWLSVDPDNGTLTVAWNYALVAGNNAEVGLPTVYVAQSKDRGDTWSAPRAIRTDDLQATQIAAGPGGETVLSYIDYTVNGYQARASRDGGATFGGEVLAISDPDAAGLLMANTNTLNPMGQSLAIDVSPGPHRGTAVMVAPERRDVLLTRSTDGGKTWTSPQHLGGNGDVLFPAVAIDPANGDVVVSWLDRHDDPKNVLARVYAVRSSDGGVNFTPPRPFSSPFALSNKMGDYDVCAVAGGVAVRAFSTASGHASVARLDFTMPPRHRAAGR